MSTTSHLILTAKEKRYESKINWNEYELPSEKTLLSIIGILVSAARTSKHDERGIPIYTTNVQLIMKSKKEKS
jgi:hypothetical protein